MFDWKKPTVQMLGRWQPWHPAHTALFKEALKITGQVCIMVRTVPATTDASGGRTEQVQDDNPFDYYTVTKNIEEALYDEGYYINGEYVILEAPNIVDISYGRTVGYSFTQHDLGEEMHNISATKIRAKMREEGKL